MTLLDALARPLGTLRLSVTDRCNLRCDYCMPEQEYVWLPRAELLDFDELARLARLFARLGACRVRLTGGEPLLRRGVHRLCAMLAAAPEIASVGLTTNGLLLADQARPLAEAGLAAITVSLDTLRPERFALLTRQDALGRVLSGIEAARKAGLSLKLDTVLLRGVNDDEIADLLRFAAENGAELRFIEYMDVGGATRWSAERVVTRAEILAAIEANFGAPRPLGARSSSPAERFALPGGQPFGVIASVTAPFCRACDRSRVTADGQWYHCLYAPRGTDLRSPLRAGASDAEIAALIAAGWQTRADRGAEERRDGFSRALVPVSALRRDPHLEMHTRGG